jgi:uncharacterized membrane protein
VRALRNGYVQRIDADGLAAFAVRHGTVVRIERGIGAFVRARRPFVSLDAATAPIAAESAALAACFVVAPMRTTEQDALFGVRQLVDVALKALSPGVNDTTTAILCVDWLGAVLVGFIQRDFPPLLRRDEKGALRVIGPIARWDEIIALAFDEIRQSAHGNATVLRRQIELLEDLAEEATSPPRRRCLRRHAEWIVLTARRTILLSVDRAPIEAAGRRMRVRFSGPASSAR